MVAEPIAYPVEEAAELVGVKRTTMFGLVKAGEVQACKIGRRTVIARAELEDYIERLRGEQSCSRAS